MFAGGFRLNCSNVSDAEHDAWNASLEARGHGCGPKQREREGLGKSGKLTLPYDT